MQHSLIYAPWVKPELDSVNRPVTVGGEDLKEINIWANMDLLDLKNVKGTLKLKFHPEGKIREVILPSDISTRDHVRPQIEAAIESGTEIITISY